MNIFYGTVGTLKYFAAINSNNNFFISFCNFAKVKHYIWRFPKKRRYGTSPYLRYDILI